MGGQGRRRVEASASERRQPLLREPSRAGGRGADVRLRLSIKGGDDIRHARALGRRKSFGMFSCSYGCRRFFVIRILRRFGHKRGQVPRDESMLESSQARARTILNSESRAECHFTYHTNMTSNARRSTQE